MGVHLVLLLPPAPPPTPPATIRPASACRGPSCRGPSRPRGPGLGTKTRPIPRRRRPAPSGARRDRAQAAGEATFPMKKPRPRSCAVDGAVPARMATAIARLAGAALGQVGRRREHGGPLGGRPWSGLLMIAIRQRSLASCSRRPRRPPPPRRSPAAGTCGALRRRPRPRCPPWSATSHGSGGGGRRRWRQRRDRRQRRGAAPVGQDQEGHALLDGLDAWRHRSSSVRTALGHRVQAGQRARFQAARPPRWPRSWPALSSTGRGIRSWPRLGPGVEHVALLGPEGNMLDPGPESCRQLRMPRPVLDNDELAKIVAIEEDVPAWKTRTLSCLYPVAEGGAGRRGASTTCVARRSSRHRGGRDLPGAVRPGSTVGLAPIPSLLFDRRRPPPPDP